VGPINSRSSSALIAIAFARGLIIVSVIVAPIGVRPDIRPNSLDPNHRIGKIFERRATRPIPRKSTLLD
jgi:hypothetical protein